MLRSGVTPRLDPRIWQMAFARAVNTMGLALAMTFLGIYVVETRGYPAWLWGLICLVANLCQSYSSAWAGALSDRIGRRPIITGSLFVRSIFIAALGTQVLLHAPIWTIAVNMVISSGLRGCFEPVAYALVADVAEPDQRIAAFGVQRMGTNLGWAIGPALGGVLTLVMPYGAVFYIAAGGMIVAGFVTLRIADPIRPRPSAPPGELAQALTSSFNDPLLRWLLVGTFFAALMQTQMFSTLSIYLTDELTLTKANVGMLYTINGLGVLLVQLPAVALVRRLGIGVVLPWASLVGALGFAIVGLGSGLGGAAIAIATITAAEVVFAPAHQSAIAEVADPTRRGRAFGVITFAQMLGIAVAPLVGGILLDTIGDHHIAMWAVIGTIGIVQAVCFHRFAITSSSASR